MPGVSGVILAAGSSTRLGRPKQLLDLAGEPLLRHVVRNALGSKLDEVIVVLGPKAAEIDEAIGYLGQRTVVNPTHEDGQSTSLRLGLESIQPDSEGAMFLLGDQPGVTPDIISRLIDCFHQSNAPVTQPRYANGPGNPVLFSSAVFPELSGVSGDEGARSVVARHRAEIAFVDVPETSIPLDVDIESDYAALIENWKRRPK